MIWSEKTRKKCGWELWVYSIACGFNTRIGGLDSQKRRKNDETDYTSTPGTCVVADRAEAIDGQAAAQGGQHAQGRQRNAVEIAELKRHNNGLSCGKEQITGTSSHIEELDYSRIMAA